MINVDLRKQPYNLDDEGVKWVEETIKSMTLEEKIGQLFIFRPVRYIAYIIGSIFGGFSFYYIAFNMIQPMTVLSNFVTLLISIIIAFIVIRKVEKIFI